MPLMGSQVLEAIDLRCLFYGVTSTGLDDAAVAGILDSMLPHKLNMVKINGSSRPGSLPFAMGDFLIRLSLTKARRAIESNAKCSTCSCVLSSKINNTDQVLAQRGLLVDYKCSRCKNYSCRSFDASARSCTAIRQCDYCSYPFCSDCVAACARCNRTSCTRL